ncbi:unnamed protein product [Spirodela intermedia]|uniref:Uncharacterized protein n=1 Tax=Spirodela intermedia TaxID=51605 RepID=A0A7I8J188_SPIIN|nr:unnamed protein product [Spirodela intermedia]CAA6663573.1 unnamed protein product [Spirodela intermedia]
MGRGTGQRRRRKKEAQLGTGGGHQGGKGGDLGPSRGSQRRRWGGGGAPRYWESGFGDLFGRALWVWCTRTGTSRIRRESNF